MVRGPGRSFWAAETCAFGAVVNLEVVLQFAQGAFHGLNETQTTCGHPAHGDDGVALGIVVGDGQDFPVGAQPVRNTFDHIVGGLPGAGEENFQFRGGFDGGKAGPGVGAVKDDGDRRADGVTVKSQPMDEFVAGGGGMAGRAGGEFRPGVQEAVAINQNSRQRHAARLARQCQNDKTKFW